ncbi:U3 snoRNP protein [Nowakowskiella sp. JEL0407]|nr:U3 snoRNP protein [Nowakowskiella sp. JEL0407]
MLEPLLDDHKLYIRLFVAESFGFMLRKTKDEAMSGIYRELVRSVTSEKSTEMKEGIALILFESMKGVKEQLHSKTPAILKTILSFVGVESKEMYLSLFHVIAHHTTAEHMGNVWQVLLNAVEDKLKDATDETSAAILLELMRAWIGAKKGSRIQSKKDLFRGLAQFVNKATESHKIKEELMKTAAVLLLVSNSVEDGVINGKPLIDAIFAWKEPKLILWFCEILYSAKWEHFGRVVLSLSLQCIQMFWFTHQSLCILYLSDILSNPYYKAAVPHNLQGPDSLLRFPASETNLVDELLTFLSKSRNWDDTSLPLSAKEQSEKVDSEIFVLSSAIMALMTVSLPQGKGEEVLKGLLESLVTSLKRFNYDDGSDSAEKMDLDHQEENSGRLVNGSPKLLLAGLAAQVLDVLITRSVNMQLYTTLVELWDLVIFQFLPETKHTPVAVRTVAAFVEALNSRSEFRSKFAVENLKKVYLILEDNLGSYNNNLRLNTLRILSQFEQEDLRPSGDSMLFGKCMVFEYCLQIENIPNSVQSVREKAILLRKLDALIAASAVSEVYFKAITRYCLALLSVNFSPLWPEVITSLSKTATQNPNLFWTIFEPQFVSVIKNDPLGMYIQQLTIDAEVAQIFDSVDLEYTYKSKNDKSTTGADVDVKFSDNWVIWLNNLGDIVGRRLEDTSIGFQNGSVKRWTCVSDRVDIDNVHAQLIKVIGEAPQLIDLKSKFIVPSFLDFVTNSNDIEHVQSKSESKLKRQRSKIYEYLTTFAKAKSPTKLHQSSELYMAFLKLVSSGDEKTQQLALECVLCWKEPGITLFAEHLKGLAGESTFRDFLSTFDMEDLRTRVKEVDRPALFRVFSRILFGKIISRRGRGSGAKSGLHARRAAVFAFLRGVQEDERKYIVELMIEPFSKVITEAKKLETERRTKEFEVEKEVCKFLPQSSQQLGFLNVLNDLLKQLKSLIVPQLSDIMRILLYVGANSESIILEKSSASTKDGKEEDEGEESEDAEVDLSETSDQGVGIQRSIRLLVIRRLTQIFEIDLTFDFTPYVTAIYRALILSRLEKLDVENTQAPSALLTLFKAWSATSEYALFLIQETSILVPKMLAILSAKGVRPEVVSYILSIIENLLRNGIDSENMTDNTVEMKILRPNVNSMLSNLSNVVSRNVEVAGSQVKLKKQDSTTRIINILAQIANFVTEPGLCEVLSELLLPFLKKNSKAVPEDTKANILRILSNTFPILPSLQPSNLSQHLTQTHYFVTMSHLFSDLKERSARQQLVAVFISFTSLDASLSKVAQIIKDLNSYSTERLDDPNFKDRMEAFRVLNQELFDQFTPDQWLPILHNLIFYMQDKEEYAIRSHASFAVSKLIQNAQRELSSGMDIDDKRVEPTCLSLVLFVLFPAIKRCLKNPSSVVRGEFITILSELVKSFPELEQFRDMVVLLGGANEEANFFLNITHVQVHRRMRALRRLSEVCKDENAKLSANTVANIFVPMLSHFVLDPTSSGVGVVLGDEVATKQLSFHQNQRASNEGNNLVNDAINAISACAGLLNWGHYYALIRRLFATIPRRHQRMEKQLIRLLVAVLDSFHFEIRVAQDEEMEDVENGQVGDGHALETSKDDDSKEQATGKDDDDDAEDEEVEVIEQEKSSTSFNQSEKIHKIVVSRLLPDLYKYLSQKDGEDATTVRVPVAISITTLLLRLPKESFTVQLPKLLTTLCHMLQSRAQSVRDSVRETLGRIAELIGPEYLFFIVRELKGALVRGYMLHVLGYTIHHILSTLQSKIEAHHIDPCVDDLTRIFVNDLFGDLVFDENGNCTNSSRASEANDELYQQKAATMREMKNFKSYDSFEITSSCMSFSELGVMLLPLKELMLETNDVKITRKITDVLKRVSSGLCQNKNVELLELMKFIHELMTESITLSQVDQEKKQKKKTHQEIQSEANFLVLGTRKQFELQQKKAALKFASANAHLLVEFGLGLLHLNLKRGQLDLSEDNVQTLELLDPFVPLLGKCLYSKHPNVTIVANRILTLICRAPLPSLEATLPVMVSRLFFLIGNSAGGNGDGGTGSMMVQASFRLLTVLIRHVDTIQINKRQLLTLIGIIKQDLQDTEKQSATFSLLRAILSIPKRQFGEGKISTDSPFVSTEVYDLMDDNISRLMITSHSNEVREQCRDAYLQFLLDYPHGPARLRKQIQAQMRNLNYEYETGRESTLLLIQAFLNKMKDTVVEEFGETLFLALVMTVVNDQSVKCREMAAVLVKELVKRMDETRRNKILKILEMWCSQIPGDGSEDVIDESVEDFNTTAKKGWTIVRTGAQISGVVIEAIGTNAMSFCMKILHSLENAVHRILDEQKRNSEEILSDDGDVEEAADAAINGWEVVYYSFSTFGKVLSVFPDVSAHEKVQGMWAAILQTCTHPHQWIRTIGARILGVLFSSIDPATRSIQNGGKKVVGKVHPFLASVEVLPKLSNVLCRQFDGSFVAKEKIVSGEEDSTMTPEMAKQIIKNLVFVGKAISYAEEQGLVLRPVSDKKTAAEEKIDGEFEEDDGGVQDDNSTVKSTSLHWLFKRMSFIARADGTKRRGILRRASVFRWYAAMAQFLDQEKLLPHLDVMLATLYRTVNDETAKGASEDELKQLGTEVMEFLKQRVGTQEYLNVYEKVHTQVMEVRRDRKQKRVIMNVTDPEASAKRKLQKTEMKRNNRKRKANEFQQKKIKMGITKKNREQ